MADALPAGTVSWRVLIVTEEHELSVVRRLRANGVDCFLPLEWRHKRNYGRGDAWLRVQEPLFPGYVFARLEPWQVKDLRRGARGQRHKAPDKRFVGLWRITSMLEGTIPDDAVAELRLIAAQVELKSQRIRPGDRVRITAGALKGQDVIVEMLRKTRASVILDMLGSRRVVDVDADQLETA